MTFTEIVDEIADRLDLTATDDTTRIGRLVNQCYRKVTTAIGLQLSRRTNVNTTASISSSNITFSSCERIINVYNRAVTPYKLIEPVTIDELRREQPYTASDNVTKWAVTSQTADTVVIEMNVIAQTAFAVYADVIATAATLSGATEPSFPESYHDILIEGVLMNEYKKSEKLALAKDAKLEYEQRLSDLKLWMALSPDRDIYQNKLKNSLATSGSGSGSSSTNGSASYTQTGLITFDRDPSAPFAVTALSAVVTNLDADKLDGLDSTAFLRVNGTLPLTAAWDAGSFQIRAETFQSDVVTGTAPFTVASTTAVTNLNADTVDGVHAAGFLAIGGGTLTGNLLFTDATYDIGASGATRPRDLYLGRNAIIGGTLDVAGLSTVAAINASGTITASTASAITLSNASAVLTFSGATIPEILFSGATGTISSNNHLVFQVDKNNDSTSFWHFRNGAGVDIVRIDETGVVELGTNRASAGILRLPNGAAGAANITWRNAANSADIAGITVDGNNQVSLSAGTLILDNGGGKVYVADSSNTNMTQGLTINQGGADDEILTLKSSDVAHGMTDFAETDTYGAFHKASSIAGGLEVRGLTEATSAIALRGMGTVEDTTHTAAGIGVINIYAYKKSGTSVGSVAANGNLLVVGDQANARFIVDVEGNFFSDDTGSTFDDHDDPMLALALVAQSSKSEMLQSLWQTYSKYNRASLQEAGIVANDGPNGERGFVNWKAATKLALGACWQLGLKMRQKDEEMEQLRLEVSEIKRKLLN